MENAFSTAFIRTIKERCRVCYTCVRECPAKAIRIVDGQADVMSERCICCGNCVKVCSQHAKQAVSSIEAVETLLSPHVEGGQTQAPAPAVAAIVAPSFPAEFTEIEQDAIAGMIRALGFRWVHEVGFGADLVADRYRKLLRRHKTQRFIATTCPALVEFVEQYQPELVPSLAPIVSPMVAMARVVRQIHGPEIRIVFIGPCIAKKKEAAAELLAGDVKAAITFQELRDMFSKRNLNPGDTSPSAFDPPHAGPGALFSVSRGMLQAANLKEDLVAGEVVAAEGRTNFVEALEEFSAGMMESGLLEVLCCNGCIMGPGMSKGGHLYARRASVSRYVRRHLAEIDLHQWKADVASCDGLDLSRTFSPNDQRIPPPPETEIATIMARMGKLSPEDELNCGACGYDTCREHAVAIFKGLAGNEMCLPYTIEQLRTAIGELAISNDQLASTQQALMQSEKLASMGQLAAGIAHEVNNPLGVVLMYSHLLMDEYGNDAKLREDLSMIVEQSDRCKRIVSGLLHFARQNKVVLQPTELKDMVDRTMKAMHLPDDIEVRIEHAGGDTTAEIDRDQMAQVLTNLVSNAQQAMPNGGSITVSTGAEDGRVWLKVTDTGCGIPKENIAKIFEPFFTTKHIGKGTGLGLAVTYGVVKMHRGDIKVESNNNPAAGPTGSTFTVIIPRKDEQARE